MQSRDNWIPLVVVLVTVAGGLVTWSLTEKAKRSHEEYLRREERYSNLVSSIHGFYVESPSTELREKFIAELELAWLYCPDDVIKKAYSFLETVQVGSEANEQQRTQALGELMLAIREDLIVRKRVSSTKLTASDFRLLRVRPLAGTARQ